MHIINLIILFFNLIFFVNIIKMFKRLALTSSKAVKLHHHHVNNNMAPPRQQRSLATVSEALKRSDSFMRFGNVTAKTPLAVAAGQILEMDGPLIVMDHDDKIIGIVTERDILRGALMGAQTTGENAHRMEPCNPSTSIKDALKQMKFGQVLPVSDPLSGRAVALLRKLDLLDVEKNMLHEKLESLAGIQIHDG